MVSAKNMLAAYPKYNEKKEFYDSRIRKVCEGFEMHFGGEPRIFSAPGRTEIGGNHTDHQHGHVLAASIDLDILAGARKNGTDIINVYSEGFGRSCVDISSLDVREDEKNTSLAIMRGIAAAISDLGYKVGGFDAYMMSDVLGGSGLSSSAAFENVCAEIMNSLFCNKELSAQQIARMGQFAENKFFGKPSGLMDQMASAVGNAVAIDFASEAKVEKVDFDFSVCGHSLCIIESGADHADLTQEYSAIPTEMCEVAKLMGKDYLGQCTKAELLKRLPEIRKKVGDRAVLRAIHFFDDDLRAVAEKKQLKNGDFEAFLSTVRESGFSSYMYLQNISVCGSVKSQPIAYALVVCSALLGERGAYRVHGGGFAGTVQAFVPNDMLDSFKSECERLVGACHILNIRTAGVCELTEE